MFITSVVKFSLILLTHKLASRKFSNVDVRGEGGSPPEVLPSFPDICMRSTSTELTTCNLQTGVHWLQII